jgi:hypothetical protein
MGVDNDEQSFRCQDAAQFSKCLGHQILVLARSPCAVSAVLVGRRNDFSTLGCCAATEMLWKEMTYRPFQPDVVEVRRVRVADVVVVRRVDDRGVEALVGERQLGGSPPSEVRGATRLGSVPNDLCH